MVDRRAVQQMLGAGLTVGEVARHFGISVRTVRRIRKEPPIESASDTESRGRRRVGRPPVSEAVRDRMRALRLADPVAPRLEVLRQLREEGVRLGESTFYRLLADGKQKRVHFAASRLKYSRWVHVVVVPNERIEALVRPLLDGFACSGGVPLAVVFDQAKTVVVGREDGRPVWNATLAQVAIDYGFAVELCAPRSPEQKGSVENLVGFVKRSFFRARRFLDLEEELPRQLQEWLVETNEVRASRATGVIPAERLEAEQERMRPLATPPADYGLRFPVHVGPTALVSFQEVRYAMPAAACGLPATLHIYLNGTEGHVVDIPAKTTPIPVEVVEGDLSRSANWEIPGEIMQPGLEMVIEVDPDGTLDPGLGVAKRIPKTGRMAVEVHEMPVLDLTVIPFLWSVDPDREVVETTVAMEADPEGHELLWDTRTLLPVGDLTVTAHDPVLSSTNDSYALFDETEAIRALEGGIGYYMGMMSGPVAGPGLGGGRRVSFAPPDPFSMAHELGHNLSLQHAPCGGPFGVDPSFPYPDGSAGVWGYDFRNGGTLVHPSTPDLMSYCRDPAWVSDYHFTNALRFRLFDESPPLLATLATEAKSLLLWGGIDAEREPFLNPAFVVDAPPQLPDSSGEHRITGRAANGDELFALGFPMPELVDGNGRSSFAFVLPVQPEWAGKLVSITLSAPGGSVTLDSDTDLPMSILRDPSTGQVRGVLRDVAEADAAAHSPQAGVDSLDVLFSRGIPDAAAWSR